MKFIKFSLILNILEKPIRKVGERGIKKVPATTFNVVSIAHPQMDFIFFISLLLSLINMIVILLSRISKK